MSGIFLKLLNLSISASWLVLVVLALRLVLKRAPKWVNVLLWGMVALRLMLPFSIESALSLIPSAETLSPETVRFDPAPTITSGVEFIDNAVNPSLSESFAAAPLASVNPLYVLDLSRGMGVAHRPRGDACLRARELPAAAAARERLHSAAGEYLCL